ncbi:MAG: hypothetical protein NUV81_01655 [bacterium]|nr:hypothetical protein [bacterium]
MKPLRIIGMILIAMLVALYEVSVAPFLPMPWNAFHPILGILVLLVAIEKRNSAFIVAGVSGFLLDLYSTGGTFFAVGRFLLLTMMMMTLNAHVLTNRSVYASITLVLLTRMFDWIWIAVASLIVALLFRSTIHVPSLESVGRVMAWDTAFVALGFAFFVFFTKRFLIVPRTRHR